MYNRKFNIRRDFSEVNKMNNVIFPMIDEIKDDEKRKILKQYVRDTFFNQFKNNTMKPKILNTLTIIDINSNTVDKSVAKELVNFCEYKDQSMKEDLYSIDLNEQNEVSAPLKNFLKSLRELDRAASYFRIITP